MTEILCQNCNKQIPFERLEAKPDAKLCVPCVVETGAEPEYMGVMVFSCKTAGEVSLVNRSQYEEINRLDPRGYKRHIKKDEEDEKDDS
jgi:hypothetical protein